jgi:type III pantothenate kinase
MNVVIDIGNSRQKVGLFQGPQLLEKHIFSNAADTLSLLSGRPLAIETILISSVVALSREFTDSISARCSRMLMLSPTLPLPVKINYRTPQTLGVDRLAAVCGAFQLFPNTNCLVVDAGTCINYELLDAAGVYQGGIISPGVFMRLQAMHHFTDSLPLLQPEQNPHWLGSDTASCMQSGAVVGACQEINGFIHRYQQSYPNLKTILTGGDAPFFESQLKPSIFVAPDLVLEGLNRILMHNAE